MSRPSPITAATSAPVRCGNTGAVPVPLPGAAPTPNSSAVAGGAQSAGSAGDGITLALTTPPARIPSHQTAPTYHCPDCGSLLCDRIRDDETRMSYPCDDGESYCAQCDALWTDDYLREVV